MTSRHLNLKYTVGDMDRVNFILRNRHLTVAEISQKLAAIQRPANADKIRQLASDFRIPIEGSR